MSTLFYVVLIVAVVVTADTIQKIYKMRHEQKRDDSGADEELERLSQLEERIRVLERIVTEDKHDLRREINRL